MSASTLIWGMILGSIGAGYLVYATRQRKGVALISAIVLFVIPYFITNVWLMVVLGIVVMVLPFLIRV